MKLINKKERLKTLLRKYDVPGPRYTSYPTVPAWKDSVTPADFKASLQSLKAGEKLSLYFHLPFCENLCHFCGCTQVITKDRSRSADYLKTLLAEIELVVQNLPADCREVSQVHFGGGTPNFFQPEEMTAIFEAIRSRFTILPDAEIAIEMHPRTSTKAFNRNLKTLGFNRISLGVQDFDQKVQALINRHQNFEMTKALIEELRSLGFDSFNLDLIYGLPGQSRTGWAKSLSQVISLKPDRLAVYSYAHVPWVRPVQRSFSEADLPAPEMKLELFEAAYQAFVGAGFSLIGMDHFAAANDELTIALKEGGIHRNFMGYSTRADAHQIGFGMSAISYVAGNYFQNQKDIRNYVRVIKDGSLATFRGMISSMDDQVRRDLITRLMAAGAVNIPDFEQQWEVSFKDDFAEELEALKPFVGDDLLQITPTRLQVVNEGFLFLRNMSMVFDRYLEKIRTEAVNPTFSRTV